MISSFEISGLYTYKQAVSYFLDCIIYTFSLCRDVNLIKIINLVRVKLKKKANNLFRTENTGGPDKETQVLGMLLKSFI